MFGRDLLVSNVLEKGASSKEVYLPEGRSAELVSQNATLCRTGPGHYVLSPCITDDPDPMVVRIL